MSGDGLIGQVGGALAGHRRAAGRDPGRSRQRPRPRGRDPDDAERRGRGARRRRVTREIDVGEVNGKRFLCIASCGFDSDANRIANETQLVKGQLVYAYAALRALARLEAGDVHAHARRRARARSPATRSPPPTARPTAAACSSPRTRSSTTACSTSSRRAMSASSASSAACRRSSRASTSRPSRSRSGARAEVRIEADRPFAVYADGDHIADLPATVRLLPRALRVIVPAMTRRGRSGAGFRAKLALARATGALSRRSGRGGGTTLPGRLLLRLAPDAISRLGAELSERRDDHQRHQRQDDDRRDARRGAARRRPRPGPQPRRLEHELGRRDRAARAARAARACSRSTRRGCRGWSTELDPDADRARQPVSRPARPLRRARAPRRRLGGDGRRARRPHRLRAQRRRSAGRRPRPRPRAAAPRRGHLLRDRGPRAGAARAPARPRRQALPPLRRPYALRARLRRPPRPLRRARTAAPTGPRPTSPRPRSSCAAWRARARRSARPPGELELELPLPGLYNVYNALAALAAALRLGVGLERAVRRAAPRSRRPSGGSRRSPSPASPVSILLIKNPAGANEVLRTLRLEAARDDGRGRRRARPLDRAQRPDRRRPRRLLDLGRRLRAARRRACGASSAPAPGRRRWRCGSSTPGSTPSRSRSSRRSSARSTAPSPSADGPALRAAHLHRADRAAHAARRRGLARGVLAMSARRRTATRSGTTSSAARYAADLALWSELAARGRRARARARLRHRAGRPAPRAPRGSR